MSKIKVSKKSLLDAIAEFALLQSSAKYIHFSFDDSNVPDIIELEGTVVEEKRKHICNLLNKPHLFADCEAIASTQKIKLLDLNVIDDEKVIADLLLGRKINELITAWNNG